MLTSGYTKNKTRNIENADRYPWDDHPQLPETNKIKTNKGQDFVTVTKSSSPPPNLHTFVATKFLRIPAPPQKIDHFQFPVFFGVQENA